MTREQKYKTQLQDLGIYHPAFDPEINLVAMMERELQRMVKDWKKAGSPVKTNLHEAIVQQRRDILSHKDAIGLTPKGLRRLKKEITVQGKEEKKGTVLQLIQERRSGA